MPDDIRTVLWLPEHATTTNQVLAPSNTRCASIQLLTAVSKVSDLQRKALAL